MDERPRLARGPESPSGSLQFIALHKAQEDTLDRFLINVVIYLRL